MREVVGPHQPVAMPFVGVVHAVHAVRRPTRIGLDADQFQFRMTFEHAAARAEFGRILARRRHEAERDRRVEAVDLVDISQPVVGNDTWCDITEFRVDVVLVAIRRFRNVRVRGDRLLCHWALPSRPNPVTNVALT